MQLKTAVEELLSKVKSIVSLSPQAEDYLVKIAKEARISKGSVLLRQGDVVNKIYFVTGGCLRSYCVDQSGREHTLVSPLAANELGKLAAMTMLEALNAR